MLPVPLTPKIGPDLQMLGGFHDANLRHVHAEWNGTICCPDGLLKAGKKGFCLSLLPISQWCVILLGCSKKRKKRKSAVDHPALYKRNQGNKALGCLDWPNRRAVPGSCVASGLLWHDEQGLFSISSSPDPGSSCQSTHKSSNRVPLLLLFWACATSRYTKLHSKQMQTRSHTPVYLQNINTIKRDFVHLQAQNN